MEDETPPPSLKTAPEAPRKKSDRLSGLHRPPDAHNSRMAENKGDEDKGKMVQGTGSH